MLTMRACVCVLCLFEQIVGAMCILVGVKQRLKLRRFGAAVNVWEASRHGSRLRYPSKLLHKRCCYSIAFVVCTCLSW